jgi:DNA-binding NarL/FixJ family response regulator
MHSGPEYVKPALHAGAKGYLVKGADVGDLVKAIRAAVKGEVFLSPGVAKVLLDSNANPIGERLSQREGEILRYVAQGKTSREVGMILGISTKTVENHRQNIMRKMEVHDVVSLTRLAIRTGLVSPE